MSSTKNILLRYKTYTKDKVHRATLNNDYTFVLACFLKGIDNSLLDKHEQKYWTIIGEDDQEVLVADAQLCGNCFPKSKKRPKVRISANTGRLVERE